MIRLGSIINDPIKYEIKEISDLVLRAQKYKKEAKKNALERINAHNFDINNLNTDQLDSLLADLTCGPGNLCHHGQWKKEHFIPAIIAYKQIAEAI